MNATLFLNAIKYEDMTLTSDAAYLIATTQHAGAGSSVGLREGISRLLPMVDYPRGAPYFKVEGIAAIEGCSQAPAVCTQTRNPVFQRRAPGCLYAGGA